MQYIKEGDRVFRVRNAAAAFEANALEPRVPVKIDCSLSLGYPAYLAVEAVGRVDDQGMPLRVEVFGDVVEKARTKPVMEQEVKDHIDRLGQTPFVAEEL